jgi:16S rRNA (cytosine967-C5)-methyltransferase
MNRPRNRPKPTRNRPEPGLIKPSGRPEAPPMVEYIAGSESQPQTPAGDRKPRGQRGRGGKGKAPAKKPQSVEQRSPDQGQGHGGGSGRAGQAQQKKSGSRKPGQGPPVGPLRQDRVRTDQSRRAFEGAGRGRDMSNGAQRGAPTPAVREVRVAQVVPLGMLAEETARIAGQVEAAVMNEGKRADRLLSSLLRTRRDLALPDQRFIARATFALFRWRGWLDSTHVTTPLDRLLIAGLLDAPAVSPVHRMWAKIVGRDPDMLVNGGDAPNWTARAEVLKRLVGHHAINADPWRLFPTWLREHLPLPPGGAPPKQKYLELLETMQHRPPLWVRVQGADPKLLWDELSKSGVRPWIHRNLLGSGKLDPDSDVHHLAAFTRGNLEIQDLASQAVGFVCDPDPGNRWWDACAGAGGKSLHLASLMQGKGVIIATDVYERVLQETVRRARRSPFRNITTKLWDGRRVAGKPGSFDGVLVDAPCSGIGTWRRNPDARWTLERESIARLAETQGQILKTASQGVKAGGILVYSVCTLTPSETRNVIRPFLEAHPEFQLDPFPHPFNGEQTDGTLQIWPQDGDCDAMFIARMIRTR